MQVARAVQINRYTLYFLNGRCTSLDRRLIINTEVIDEACATAKARRAGMTSVRRSSFYLAWFEAISRVHVLRFSKWVIDRIDCKDTVFNLRLPRTAFFIQT